MRKYLILEDDSEYVKIYEALKKERSSSPSTNFEYVHVSSVEDAREKLEQDRFMGAILDLRLSKDEIAEGNKVARRIHQDYFMPIAIVSGIPDELDPDLITIAEEGSGPINIFNKNGKTEDIFNFLLKVESSGVLQIFGPSGEMSKILSLIFWKHLGSMIKKGRDDSLSGSEKKRILRHAVGHMIGTLQSTDDGNWDHYLPNEVYIWPHICEKEMTGDIYQSKSAENEYYLLVTPACDIASKDAPDSMRHFIRILPFSLFPTKAKIEGKVSKKEHRYHVLPPGDYFGGGVLDFATLQTIQATDTDGRFVRTGSLIEPFRREIVTRLGAWIGRQGTPDFERENLINLIKLQWPKESPPS